MSLCETVLSHEDKFLPQENNDMLSMMFIGLTIDRLRVKRTTYVPRPLHKYISYQLIVLYFVDW